MNAKTVNVEVATLEPKAETGALILDGGAEKKGDKVEGERRVEVEERRKKGEVFGLGYDKLVVAVGCYSQTFGTKGVKENALFLKDVSDARKIRKRILDCESALFFSYFRRPSGAVMFEHPDRGHGLTEFRRAVEAVCGLDDEIDSVANMSDSRLKALLSSDRFSWRPLKPLICLVSLLT